ncbi:MAG: class I SAM-dependent methyltransferase [Candidatus Hinthialibacter antarcticus]|nr:class I SAM-dependent methyltransferase [Candidatus Hinthialibacter antarcticus]
MKAAPTISILANCDRFDEQAQGFFDSILAQTYSQIELLVPKALFTCVQEKNNIGSISIKPISSSSQNTLWYKDAFAQASGDIIVFASPEIRYAADAFLYAASVFAQYPQCGTLIAQSRLLSQNGPLPFDPYDLIPLIRYDRLPPIETLFFAKQLCAGRVHQWSVEASMLGMVFSWMMHDVPIVVAQTEIGVMDGADDAQEETVESTLMDCKKRFEYQSRLLEIFSHDEVVKTYCPYSMTEIFCQAAEKIERLEGQSERFRNLVQRAAQSSQGTYRLEQLQAKLTGKSSDAEAQKTPIDPNFNAEHWWDSRYATGGNSGAGSYGANYMFKRDYINAVVRRFEVKSVIDLGCGDGYQIKEIDVEAYQGVDISASVVNRCRKLYENQPAFSFNVYDEIEMERYDLAMSLDVLYHVVEPDQYGLYLNRLVSHSGLILIYANATPRSDNTAHMLFRDHIAEIQKRAVSARIIEKVMNPLIPNVGFILFEITA